MAMDAETFESIAQGVIKVVNENAKLLTQLDQAIGDGDHGNNMKRGVNAVAGELESLAAKPLPEALKAVGMKLVMSVGGASGPLYGTLFMSFGKSLGALDQGSDGLTQAQIGEALTETVAAVKARGKSDFGQKTMLDVWGPVTDLLNSGKSVTVDEVAELAQKSADATVEMLAIKGRASFLGERSIGHMDPGACSSALIIRSICQTLETND